ncbi:GNAT family N-acetyltransferase [Streptomyces sp. ISL-12]|uniref:GNAT family N-acetyltransferase n=1 Tax=Streptomyces sp. ISL-12 TaxID=2819177 RepID=UPI001BE78D6D|nr:GNAT family N-acetyltransferase [Streptomyces sp. ISL-12]MBT2413293.1 GNAT family N-acetyltransferase [Streptomyces sp. ISL-12]
MGGATTGSLRNAAVRGTAVPPAEPDTATGWATRLRDGATTRTRLAANGDLPYVNALHARCSRQSLMLRYLSGRQRLTAAEWRALAAPSAGLTWVTHPAGAPGHVVAVTHVLYTDRTPGSSAAGEAGRGPAELALLIDDTWQSRGLGTALVTRAVAVARQRGHGELHALVLSDNRPALALARVLGGVVTPQGSQCTVRLPLPRRDGAAPDDLPLPTSV